MSHLDKEEWSAKDMARQPAKSTIRMLEHRALDAETRITRLETAMGEVQQALIQLMHASMNDARRHELMLIELCESTGVDYEAPPNLEESPGGSEE